MNKLLKSYISTVSNLLKARVVKTISTWNTKSGPVQMRRVSPGKWVPVDTGKKKEKKEKPTKKKEVAQKPKNHPIHTPGFKNWFGDWTKRKGSKVVNKIGEPAENYHLSKVLDKKGKPIPVYHGTSMGGFNEFKKELLDKNALYGAGFYFTEDKGIANEYTEKGSIDPNIHSQEILDFMEKNGLTITDLKSWSNIKKKSDIIKKYEKDKLKYISTFTSTMIADLKQQFNVQFTGKKEVKEVYLNIRKPFDIDKDVILFDDLSKKIQKKIIRNSIEEEGIIFDEPIELGDDLEEESEYKKRRRKKEKEREKKEREFHSGTRYTYDSLKDEIMGGVGTELLNEFLKSKGYDGLTHIGGNIMGGKEHRVWIAFEPNQIKASTAKEFDPLSNDIYKSYIDKMDDLLLLKGKKKGVGDTSQHKDGSTWKKIKDKGPNRWVRVIKIGNKTIEERELKGKKIIGKGLDIGKKEKQSIKSPYYYQVKVGKALWKKYKTLEAYKKDFPRGPQKGHILVNHNHDAHLRFNRNTFYAKVGNKEYKSRAEFLKEHSLPSKEEIKDQRKSGKIGIGNPGIKEEVIADFHHPDWHPSKEKRLNSDQRTYLGVEGNYRKYRKNYLMNVKSKESYQRLGKNWTPKQYEIDKFYEEEERATEALERKKKGVVKKGSKVIFNYRGKELKGKVIEVHSIGKEGQKIKKAASHYDIEYDKNQHMGSLKKPSKVIAEKVNAENVNRERYARQVKSKELQSSEYEEKKAKKAESILGKLMKKMKAKNEYELQAKIGEKLGDLGDKNNPYRKIVAVKVAKEIKNAVKLGHDPFSVMTFNDLVWSGLAGVIDAMVDWDEKKSSLPTFLQSDKVKDYIREHIRDSISVETGSFYDIKSYDVKLAVMNMKHIINNMTAELGYSPKVDEIKERYLKWFGNKKTLDLSKLIQMAKMRKVNNIIDDIEQGGKMDIIESVMSHYRGPEQQFIESETLKDFHSSLDKLVSPAEGLAMKLKYRVDETSTGMGVKGELSPYYNTEKEDISGHEGKVHIPGWHEGYQFRTDKEVASIMSSIGLDIKPEEVKEKIESGKSAILKKFGEGNKDAKKLHDIWLKKSLVENFTKMLLLKSLPDKETRWIKQQNHIIRMVNEIFSERMAA